MKANYKNRLMHLAAVVAALSLLLSGFSVGMAQPAADPLQPVAEIDPAMKIEIAPDNSWVLIENSQIQVGFSPFDSDGFTRFAITSFIYKAINGPNQAVQFLDGDDLRGALKTATLTYDGTDKKTVELVWGRTSNPAANIAIEYTIYPHRNFLQIFYKNVKSGVNVVDLGRPGGTEQGQHWAYGGDQWAANEHPEWPAEYGGYVTKEYTGTVGSYYNRLVEDGINDPADGGALKYNQHFIYGVYNPKNGDGFGRTFPVALIKVIKLLADKSHRRGFESLHFGATTSFTSYLFPVINGSDDIMGTGKSLIDGQTGSFDQSDFKSDDFDRCNWNNGNWTFENPVGDVQVSGDGGSALISVPAGVDHDIWGTGPGDFAANAGRIMQTVSNTDFEIEAKFDIALTKNIQTQGILVKQDDNDMMRFEFYTREPNFVAFMGRITEGVGSNIGGNVPIVGSTGISPLWMKVRRSGDTWTMMYSLDGQAWSIVNTVYSAMVVSQIGVYAGNTIASGQPDGTQPAFNASIDYVQNTFAPIANEDGDPNTVTVNIAGVGSVTKSPDKTDYACGEQVTLTAAATTGGPFIGWSGAVTGSNPVAQLTVTGDHTVTASFDAATYTLNANAAPSGGGTVTKTPNKATYLAGEKVTLTASPAAGYRFFNWGGDATGTTASLEVTVTKNMTVTANFVQLNAFGLNLSISGQGTVTKSPDKIAYTKDEQVTLTAVAASGWVFQGWSGDATGTNPSTTLTMSKDMNVVATFEDTRQKLFIPAILTKP